MNYWEDLGLEEKVLKILSEMPLFERARHFGRPFLTSYQIAIEFARRYPHDFAQMAMAIGGEEHIHQQGSLAQYIAQHLSAAVKAHHPHLEGGILTYLHLEDMTFDYESEIIRPSRFPVAMFRYLD
jgi:hypothetical protein